jgi:hypothetical protein
VNRAVLTLIVVVGALLAACGTSDRGTAADRTSQPVVQQTPDTSSAVVAPAAGPTARQVVERFIEAGLSAPNPRDNSHNCTGNGGMGCVQLITTDAISVYSWPTEATAQHQAEGSGDNVYRKGLIVLSYGAARTPQADRPKYEAVLNKLVTS